VGWNLGLVGGSALLTDAIVPERRAQTQGAADLVMGVTAISGNLLRDRSSTLAPSASWAPGAAAIAPRSVKGVEAIHHAGTTPLKGAAGSSSLRRRLARTSFARASGGRREQHSRRLLAPGEYVISLASPSCRREPKIGSSPYGPVEVILQANLKP
jgi:hypothetical protein